MSNGSYDVRGLEAIIDACLWCKMKVDPKKRGCRSCMYSPYKYGEFTARDVNLLYAQRAPYVRVCKALMRILQVMLTVILVLALDFTPGWYFIIHPSTRESWARDRLRIEHEKEEAARIEREELVREAREKAEPKTASVTHVSRVAPVQEPAPYQYTVSVTAAEVKDFDFDGKIDCIDYTIAYMKKYISLYGRDGIAAMQIYDIDQNFNHLYVRVRYNGVWKDVEPQKGNAEVSSYWESVGYTWNKEFIISGEKWVTPYL